MEETKEMLETSETKTKKKRRKYVRKAKQVPPAVVTDTEAPITDRDGMEAIVEPGVPGEIVEPNREDLDIIVMGDILPSAGSLPDPVPGEPQEINITMQRVSPRKFNFKPKEKKTAKLPALTMSKLPSRRK